MRLNKKSMSEAALVALIIVIVVAVLLITFFYKLEASDEKSAREVCRNSAIQQSLAIRLSNDLVNLQCPTYNIKFFENKVEKNTHAMALVDPETKNRYVKFDELTDETVNRVVAEELRWCWYQFLEGKNSLFDMSLYFGKVFGKDQRLCYICDEISFDVSIEKDVFSDFYQYTKDTMMLDSEMTYYDYYAITKDTGIMKHEDDWESYFYDELVSNDDLDDHPDLFPYLSKSPDFKFHKDKTYMVAFIRRGYRAKVDAPLSADDESYWAYVLPEDAIPFACSKFLRGTIE